MSYQDIFLKVETKKQGPIKGESHDDIHKDEIDVVGWRWGMQARTALGGGGDAPKATVNELVVTKRLDSASTALMGALRNNDEIKKAVLTCRKAGKGQHDAVRITIQSGRITGIEVTSGREDDAATLNEQVTFAFKKITVEYIPQGEDGQPRGSMMFETEIN
jgi:type VI secretion system secreted protein Hcp